MFQEVKDLYGAVVKMLDSGDKIKVDQSHLETVIPAIGKGWGGGLWGSGVVEIVDVKQQKKHKQKQGSYFALYTTHKYCN